MAFSYLLAKKISCSAILSKKEFTIISELKFFSMSNFRLSLTEHEKSCITSGPVLYEGYNQLNFVLTWSNGVSTTSLSFSICSLQPPTSE